MRTDFDFRDANIAVQKALNKVRESEGTSNIGAKEAAFDEWSETAAQKKPKEQTTGEFIAGLDNDY